MIKLTASVIALLGAAAAKDTSPFQNAPRHQDLKIQLIKK
jgi:hypothetical protein